MTTVIRSKTKMLLAKSNSDDGLTRQRQKLHNRWVCQAAPVPGCVRGWQRVEGGSRAVPRVGPLAAPRRWDRRYHGDSWIRTWTPSSGGWGPPQP